VLFDAIEHFLARAQESSGEEQDGHIATDVVLDQEQ